MVFASKKRSMLKTLSWRTIASLDTFLLTWVVTGSPTAGLTVSGLEIVTKMILYYFHERAWIRNKYGIDKDVKKVIDENK